MNPFVIYIEKSPKLVNVSEVGNEVYQLITAINKVHPNWIMDTRLLYSKLTEWDWSSVNTQEILQKEVLNVLTKDIKKYNMVSNPDLSFCRQEGFVLTLISNAFSSIVFQIGSNQKNIVSMSFYDDIDITFQDLVNLAISIVNTINPMFISFNDPSFLIDFNDLYEGKFKVGWMNYFQDKSKLPTSNFTPDLLVFLSQGVLFSTIYEIFDYNNVEHIEKGVEVLNHFRSINNIPLISKKVIKDIINTRPVKAPVFYKKNDYIDVEPDLNSYYAGINDQFNDVEDYIDFIKDINYLSSLEMKAKLVNDCLFIKINDIDLYIPDNILKIKGFQPTVLKYINHLLYKEKLSKSQFCLISPFKESLYPAFHIAFFNYEEYLKESLEGVVDITTKNLVFFTITKNNQVE